MPKRVRAALPEGIPGTLVLFDESRIKLCEAQMY